MRHGLPVLALERVMVDLACSATPADALAVLDQAFLCLPERDREAFRRRLRERLQDRPDARGTRIGRRLVDLATGRAESPPESWWLWRMVDLGGRTAGVLRPLPHGAA
jgi:GNAT superfamily N-acetyltransferase